MRLIIALLSLIALAAQAIEPSPSWTFAFPQGEEWKVAYTHSDGREYSIEYTQGNEKVEAWSQLVTVMFFRVPRKRFEEVTSMFISKLQLGCSALDIKTLESSDYKRLFHYTHNGCEGMSGEEVLARYEYVDDGVLTLQYAYVKGKASPNWPAWVDRVSNATLSRITLSPLQKIRPGELLPIPANSAVMLSTGRGHWTAEQVYSRLQVRMNDNYNCRDFTIDRVEWIGVDKGVVANKKGVLIKGTIEEKWYITACGSPIVLRLLVTPIDAVALAVGFSEISEEIHDADKILAP